MIAAEAGSAQVIADHNEAVAFAVERADFDIPEHGGRTRQTHLLTST
ncbi:hypothetical protein [Streptomyces sp. NPDC047000]